MNSLDRLVQQLGRLPGLGRKSALRLGYYLLRSDASLSNQLGHLLLELKEKIRPCQICGNYTEETVCDICQDLRREDQTICVVEQAQDIAVLEASHEFRGRYHVLHGVLAPLDGVGPEQLNLSSLVRRVRDGRIEEIILATNPTLEGDTTALYIKQLFAQNDILVSRLALGLPVGGDLEYADRLTLARSLKGRTRL
jgi:recombination protein RecR